MNFKEDEGDFLDEIIITVDGPSGSGKSTTARELAGRLGLIYLDTGAMYRAVTSKVLKAGIDPADEEEVTAAVDGSSIDMDIRDGAAVLLIDGSPVGEEIRGPEVSNAVSPVSQHPGVRRAMVRFQRYIAGRGGVIAEGRDTGSTVFPFAHVKIFLIADMDARAARRVRQLEQMGISQSEEEIRANLEGRDRIDSSRQHSPLVRPTGSWVVDTSDISIEEQVSLIEDIVLREAKRLKALRSRGGRGNPYRKGRNSYYSVAQAVIRFFARMLFGLRIHGSDNLRYAENFFFASNHISWYDPPLVGSTLEREVWFVAKKELFRKRIFAWLIRKYHAIPIDREGFDRSTLKSIDAAFEKGDSVLMFPEGTRSRTGRLKDFKPGIGMIAYRSGRTIVPAYIAGSDSLKECFLRKRRLEVRIGKPLRIPEEYESDDRKADYAVLSSMIRESLLMLEDETFA